MTIPATVQNINSFEIVSMVFHTTAFSMKTVAATHKDFSPTTNLTPKYKKLRFNILKTKYTKYCNDNSENRLTKLIFGFEQIIAFREHLSTLPAPLFLMHAVDIFHN